jgi:hypothetical protein
MVHGCGKVTSSIIILATSAAKVKVPRRFDPRRKSPAPPPVFR